MQNQLVAEGGLELVQQSPRKQAITTERDAEYDPRCAEIGAVDAILSELITLAPAARGQPAGSTPSAGLTVTYQRPLEGPLWAIDLEVLPATQFCPHPPGVPVGSVVVSKIVRTKNGAGTPVLSTGHSSKVVYPTVGRGAGSVQNLIIQRAA